MTVHIVCSTFNGARFLDAFVQSLQRQTDADWRLWTRDNGSTDGSPGLIESFSASDDRIRVTDRSRTPLGVVGTFARLLDLLPVDADYVMLADQDDVWLPDKIECTLAAMHDAEREAPGPVLVHTDLIVVDEALNQLDDSFWHYNRVNPEPVPLRQVVVKNGVTAGTVLMNRPLRDLVGHIPEGAAVHDWWVACVATAFGRVVALPRPTVLYRQHDANVIGAQRPLSALALHELVAAAPSLKRRTTRMRANIVAAARQARAFLDRFADQLSPADRRFLDSYSRIPEHSFLARKVDLFRMQLLPGNTLLQNIGILLRA